MDEIEAERRHPCLRFTGILAGALEAGKMPTTRAQGCVRSPLSYKLVAPGD